MPRSQNLSPKAQPDGNLPIPFQTLQIGIGLLGMAMPVALALSALVFGAQMQPSLSHFFHVPYWHVFFVGPIFAIGAFLWLYPGYPDAPKALDSLGALGISRLPSDKSVTSLAGALLLLVAVVPTTADCQPGGGIDLAGTLHLVAAGLFFALTALLCLAYFTRTNQLHLTWTRHRGKMWRNRVYRICGWTMLACLAALLAYSVMTHGTCPLTRFPFPVFTLESIAIFAFGLAWLVKSGAINPVMGWE